MGESLRFTQMFKNPIGLIRKRNESRIDGSVILEQENPKDEEIFKIVRENIKNALVFNSP